MSESADVVIIGAGVIGCAIACEMARRGHRTLNLDRGAGAGMGSTSSSSAIVRFSYSTETGVNFSWEGGHYWRSWGDHVGDVDELGLAPFVQCGQLVLLTDAADHSARVQRLWDRLDIPYELLDLADLAERYPFLDHGLYGPPARPDDPGFWRDATGTLAGALFSADAGYVSDPQLAAHNLQRAAEAAGGRFRFGVEVVEVSAPSGRVAGVVLATGDRIAAPVVINVAGPHSAHVNRLAGVHDTMQISTTAVRQEVHHIDGPSDLDFSSSGVLGADDDLGFYYRPDVGNTVLIGSVEPDCDPLEYVDVDDYNRSITEDLWEAQVLRANRRMPSLGVPHKRRGIVDCYDVTDDWMPIYDRTDLDGFYVAIGTSGNQFKNAGVVGQAMADLIEAVESGHDHDADPVRLTGRHTSRTVDLGVFGRNRVINPESSMTVHG